MIQRCALLSVLFIASITTPLLAQGPYWGMTAAGGSGGVGSIYTITESNVFTTRHSFFQYEGGSPKGDLIKATNGLYYGVTEFGGTDGVGVLFSYNPSTATYTVLRNFSSNTTTSAAVGARPIRGVVQAQNGRLYGTCSAGGLNSVGTLWEYNITTSTFSKKFDFNAVAGASRRGSTPRGRLLVASNGTIYGTTQLGGANGRGCIFSYSAGGTTNTVLYDFPGLPGTTGIQPYSGLTQATGGLLYGTTQLGGANGVGVLYSFNPTGPVYTKLHDFDTGTGRTPLGEPVQAANGNIYGTTSSGGTSNGGVIYGYVISTGTYTAHVNLDNTTGSAPFSRLVQGSGQLLYGTTSSGGPGSAGVIFSFNTSTNVFDQVYFMNSGGFSESWGAVLEDPAGTLVCMTSAGGAGGQGALFKYVPATFTATSLVPFSFSNGSNPRGRLVKASDGLFYGLTNTGGTNSSGILFSINPATNQFTLRANMDNTIGKFPLGTMVEANGKLYGVCSAGGTADGGTLFEYTLSNGSIVRKIDFSLTAAGTAPENGLYKASNGILYGNTSLGAGNGLGAFFEYVAGSTSVTVRRNFSSADGSRPLGDVFQAGNGLLYGTTSENGLFAKGTLFSFNPANNAFAKLYDFDGLQGGVPAGSLMQATNGKLYGVFREDGQGNSGGIYSWAITSGTYTEEYDFNIPPTTTEGNLPECNLIQGADGLLYGTASQGGSVDQGLIFRFNPTSLITTTLVNFTGAANGSLPDDALTTENTVSPSSVQLAAKAFLQGPFVSATGKMNATLRNVAGFPTTEPFTAAGFTIVGGGGETINPSVLTTAGDNAVVDWILVELRDKNNSSVVLRTKAGLIQSDGDIVDTDNSSALSIPVASDNYFVAIRHRNHFGVMTANSIALSGSPTTLDLTTGALATFGTNAQQTVNGYRVNWSGNTVRNNNIKYTGAGNDRDPILVRVGSTTPNNTVAGYFQEDVTLNGTVQYTGSGNDRDPILVNIGGTTPNATITEQLP